MLVLQRFLVVVIVTAAALAVGVPAMAAERVGEVTRLQADATAKNVDENRTLQSGSDVFDGDVLSTGRQARLEVTFVDGTVVTLGENAVLEVTDYIYDPDGDNSVSTLDMITGAFLMATGEIGRQDPDDVTVRTNLAVVGIRGTQFWGGPIDGNYGVLLLDGSISVTTDAGTVILTATGEGTTVTDAGTAPSDPVIWPDDKTARAFETVTFDP